MKNSYKILTVFVFMCFPILMKAQSWHQYAYSDAATTQMNQMAFIFVIDNDDLNPPPGSANYSPGPFILCDYPFAYGSMQSLHGGTISFLGDSLAIYNPPTGFIGTDYFYYAICAAGTTYQLDTAKVTVIVQGCPPLGTFGTINGNQSVYCKNSWDNFSVNPVTNATHYSWTVPSGAYTSANGTSANIHFGPQAVAGDIIVTAYNSCGQSVSSTPYSITMNNMILSVAVTNATSPASCDGSATVSVNGGTPPYAYYWSPSNINTPQANNLCQGIYSVIVTDAMGCYDTVNVNVGNSGLMVSTQLSNPSCGLCNGTVAAIVSGGTAPYTYLWSPAGLTSPSIQICDNGSPETYTVQITDANNHSVTATVTSHAYCDSVWPGETDLDSVVTMQDLFPIGLAYGLSGPLRANASLNWYGQAAADWNSTTGWANNKHVDTNGDGIINSDDTVAVITNLGLTRSSASASSSGGPVLTLKMPVDPLGVDEEVALPIHLGSSSAQANGVYGITFRLQWDPSLVDPASVSFDASTGWLGTLGTDAFKVAKHNIGSGQMDIAIIRTNQANESGYGEIGSLNFKTAAELQSGYTQPLGFEIFNVHMIDASGTELDVTAVPSATEVSTLGLATAGNKLNFRMYPNPTNAEVYIENPDGTVIESIKIFNSVGVLCYAHNSKDVRDSRIKLEPGLNPGVYYIFIKTPEGMNTRALVIIEK